MLSLSGLWTVCPDLVLTVSHPGLFPLIHVVEGPPVTAVQELWSGLLFAYRASHATLHEGRGTAPILPIMGPHIPSHWGVFPLFSPFYSSVWIVFCMALDPQSCTSCLVSPFPSISNLSLSSSQPTAFLISFHRYCSTDISVTYVFCILCDKPPHHCHLYCVGITWVITAIGLHYDCLSIALHPHADHYYRPCEKERFFEYYCP